MKPCLERLKDMSELYGLVSPLCGFHDHRLFMTLLISDFLSQSQWYDMNLETSMEDFSGFQEAKATPVSVFTKKGRGKMKKKKRKERRAPETPIAVGSARARGDSGPEKDHAIPGPREKWQSFSEVTDKGAANFRASCDRHVDFVYYVCGRNTGADPSCHQYRITPSLA
ncbi:hypothetical protein PoB_006871900 [Plakobranchus ocellatus]|uniref:Uncharacterized protein n=1 Tax=Plakobranchus ocellatus TaxID=259542 RepID=A0AAV4DDD7_9GAST|nr:hypothetical protein PoB_006871900 [Plakobranchus ocellatus]